ncbi:MULTISPECIES: DUF935 family protein [unclassified Ensifer]|uniref:phage portal protein family protein n=1 Tax=unclassified Ensifer TaxID=2633371 RepID=UPI000812CB17|nr:MULTISPECIES: DUF935 family protein [unclassified Ensifer]OCP17383.1 hypothetical protein BC361_07950 [Ensifer sp. LC54]OCP28712.1 hypothetical protein BC363_02410 [Ensifer sp. LC384]
MSKRRKGTLTEAERKNLPADAKTLIATARNDITIPFYSGLLQHADDTLIQRGGGKGLKIYDEIERDGHAHAVLQKRRKQLIQREWEVTAASDAPIDVEAADFCRERLKALPFDRLTEEMVGGATLKGYAVQEVVWKRDGRHIVPAEIVTHDQRRFGFNEDWRPRLLTLHDMRLGMELPERKFIVHRVGVIGNNPYGLGLGTRLFWPVLFKREGIAFWLHFLDKYAGPTVVGKTPYGSLNDEQSKLLNNLQRVRTSSALIVPVGTDVEFLEASRSGSVSYEGFLAYWNKEISITVTGETLTTDIGSAGSRAASETHEGQLDKLVDGDGDLFSDTYRGQLLTWITEYNFPGAQAPFLYRVRPSNERDKAETRKAKAEAATAENSALQDVLMVAANFDDDTHARDYITQSGLTERLSEETVKSLVEARFSFMEGGKRGRDVRQAAQSSPAFAAMLGGQKKNSMNV